MTTLTGHPACSNATVACSANWVSISTVVTFSAPTTEASKAALYPLPVPISSTDMPGDRSVLSNIMATTVGMDAVELTYPPPEPSPSSSCTAMGASV